MNAGKPPSEAQISMICKRLATLPADKLEYELASMLKEPKVKTLISYPLRQRHILHSAVKHVQRDVLLEVLKTTIEVQCQGNLAIFDKDDE